MTRMSVVKAKANFSRLLAEVEAGGEVVITRRGTAVARISAVARNKSRLDVRSLADFRAGIKASKKSSVELIRRLRDARY